MDKAEMIGVAAGVLTSVSMIPQLVKIIKEKKAGEISILMIVVLIIGLAGWAVYGFMKDDLPIIVTNCFSVLVNVIILFFRLKYSESK